MRDSLQILVSTTKIMLIWALILTIFFLALWQASELGDNCIDGYHETTCEVTP